MSNGHQAIGMVLAGGASRRMGGSGKALADLGGKPMIDYVVEALEPQVSELWLSVATDPGPLPDHTHRQLVDPEPRHCGPLAGLLQGLKALPDNHWLIVAPCDAPFLPADLVQRLLAAASQDSLAVLAQEGEQAHPTFSAWRKEALPEVAAALAASKGLWQTMEQLPHGTAHWELATPSPFYNVNEPGDLERACQWLEDIKS